jgi:hypothetical protein
VYLTSGKDGEISLASHHKQRSRKSAAHVHKSPSRRPSDLLAYSYKRLKAGQPVAVGHAEHNKGQFQSVREIEYNGHKIAIYTQYAIRVDGKPISGHVYVDNSGKVSAHALPNYSFASAVDLVKKIIDQFPDDFNRKKSSRSDNAKNRRR